MTKYEAAQMRLDKYCTAQGSCNQCQLATERNGCLCNYGTLTRKGKAILREMTLTTSATSTAH